MARTSSEKVTSRFCNHFAIILRHYACTTCSNYPEIKLEPALQREDGKIKHLSSYAHVVHTTAKQKISRRGKNENVYEKKKNKECTCKACKTTIFRRQIHKFVTFSLPSSSWLLKLPNNRELKKDDGNRNARKQ